jgi:UDP-N-acetyl-D-glucosamine dehydrogenase
MTLQEKIETRTARIGIIGLGYVGLPLAVEFGKAGFHVHGFDLDEEKVTNIKTGFNYIPDVDPDELRKLCDAHFENVNQRPQLGGSLTASSVFTPLADMDAVIICVPTPLKKTKDPDIQYIVAACESIARHLHSPMLISLESSTYPGTTDELMLPMFQREGFEVGKDFFLCFSPERVDPGNKDFHTKNIPKVIGGITPECTRLGQLLYETAIQTIIPVQGTRTAEMVKLLENTFRMVNIGLVNELAIMCDKMNINIWEVIDAAKTKPFGFMPFYPGPGLGGHCIPIDPFYFSWKAKQYGCEPRFIETAGYANAQMPHYVVQKVQDALNKEKKAINGSKILILGMAYKRDIDDVRESPALDVAHLLLDKGAELQYFDMYIPKARVNGYHLESLRVDQIDDAVDNADCIVITTDHSYMDYKDVVEHCKLIVDTRNALKGLNDPKIVRI